MKKIRSCRRQAGTLLTFLLLSLSLPAAADIWGRLQQLRQARTETSQAITYTPSNWPSPLNGDLYLPAGDVRTEQLRPVVVVVHGGAWRRGDKSDQESLGRALAGHGYAAFAINYRLAPAARHPAQLEDMQQALRWLQQHAEEYRLDMQRLALWGYSAGGHLAALLAMQPVSDLPVVKVVVAGGTPVDLRDPAAIDPASVRAFLGGTPQQIPVIYERASPLTLVRPGLPAFFLYHGTADKTVPPRQAEKFAHALAAAGVPVELVWLEGQSHDGAAMADDVRPLALDYLEHHLGLATETPNGLQTRRDAPARLIRMAFPAAADSSAGADTPTSSAVLQAH